MIYPEKIPHTGNVESLYRCNFDSNCDRNWTVILTVFLTAIFLPAVLLSASIERFDVSCMQDFFWENKVGAM